MKIVIKTTVVLSFLVSTFFVSNTNFLGEYELNDLFSMAYAQTEDFAEQPGKRTKNVSCIKEISITGHGGGTSKFGYRDKCKRKGSGCRPTVCK